MDKKEMTLTAEEKEYFKGGVRSMMVFLKDNEVVDESEANAARFLVFDKNDNIIYESYGSLEEHSV